MVAWLGGNATASLVDYGNRRRGGIDGTPPDLTCSDHLGAQLRKSWLRISRTRLVEISTASRP